MEYRESIAVFADIADLAEIARERALKGYYHQAGAILHGMRDLYDEADLALARDIRTVKNEEVPS